MAVLDKSTQDKIDNLSERSYDLYESGDKEGAYKLMEDAWHLYPEPRENWNESFNTAKEGFRDLIKDQEIDRASVWFERLKKVQQNLMQWEGEFEFYEGVFFFEKKEYGKAIESFKKMFQIDEGRSFEDEDPKYKDFYLHPEKYMDKE